MNSTATGKRVLKKVDVTVHQKGIEDKSEQAAAIQRMFSSISPRYDFLNRFLSLGIDKSWRKKAVDEVWKEGTQTVLDVCAGTGDLSLAFMDRMKTGRITATDFCYEMLEIARPKLVHEQIEHGLVQADATRLPFRSEQFDVVGVAFGIRNVTDLDAGICEMARAARAGGRVVILEFSQPENSIFSAIYLFYFRHILPLIGRLLSGSHIDAYRYLPESVLAFATAEQLKSRMELAGLVDVSCRKLMCGAVTIHVGNKP
ncbi:MAG: bifunctional demethylmenaquinone methyltransferase/2-methoxy-6-polyprenyl-1,4-benzoquinol methylase UbiE [Planctomycetota bacterium]|jgi:demethylmenaquinone methyltransferase/2-methoxy-6-polyprenyl-1,4-benzoquinol methylase|nr:bifunctional demethylmenaquinone methyltransferase/2-methoxy-6-polyprenyl-1,4-benzoquinol methylase UbiE [Planctomycetota bacterium]MDP7249132.1 bifunctional demethylmenaquinone methyltransferase/2-methoxy-6-polyprenyl-1,4-benzoquinol methylase UbiE [Planctomycetota bacterium]